MDFPIELDNGLIIHSADSPKWANEEQTKIDLTIYAVWPHYFETLTPLPFTATPNDPLAHGVALFEAFKGDPSILPYEKPLPTVEDLQADLDKIMPDVILGLADEKTISLARTLRTQIKAMSQ